MVRLGKAGFHFNAIHSFPKDTSYDRFPHGHDYDLTVMLEGRHNSGGMLFDIRSLKEIVDREVVAPLDHRNLDDVLPDSSLESLAQWIWERLRSALPSELRVGLTLWETRSIFIEYWGD